MRVEATTTAALASDADTVAVGAFDGEGVAHDFGAGTLQALLDRGEARTALEHLAVAHADNRRVILVGLGSRSEFDAERARIAAALVDARARELGARSLCWEAPHHVDDRIVAALVEGTLLHAYRFERYKPTPDAGRFDRLIVSAHHDVSEPVRVAAIISGAQNRARDLANTPPNDLTPTKLAEYAEKLQGVAVEVWDEERIRAAGMGAFTAVAQGSIEPPRMIVLGYEGRADGPSLAMIGKAITFDSGGLALKSRDTMLEMKFDMSGGAAVIESMAALSELRAPVRVLGVVGAAENMPSATAVRAGDIVRASDGTTIEVNNPDAEGRLVLADCITYARGQGCERLVDIATLTNIDSALGSVYAGLMCNDDAWAAQILECGRRAGDPVWRMPLHPRYAEMIAGRYAQLTNRSWRREAFPLTAAEFLHHFAGDVPWAHLDIAGTAWDVQRPYYVGQGATGFGVRLLVELATTAALAGP